MKLKTMSPIATYQYYKTSISVEESYATLIKEYGKNNDLTLCTVLLLDLLDYMLSTSAINQNRPTREPKPNQLN